MTRRFLFLTTVILALGCRRGDDTLTPGDGGLTPGEQVTIAQYLNCIDCTIALDSVRALAGRKSEAAVDTLGRALLVGPGATDSAATYDVLQAGYTRDSLWRLAQGMPNLPDRLSYVDAASALYVNGYRAQGAIALGWIHTPRAVQLLDSALTLPLAPDLRRMVLYARDSLPRTER